ncbi:MAG: hypothetical protein IIB00_01865 [candidate division Zixibacteria bacterium]|nr:hypothetical protein [candidate division Zixibacteria bacterium]
MRVKDQELRNIRRSRAKSFAISPSKVIGPILLLILLTLIAGTFLSCGSGKYGFHPDNIYWRDDDKQNIPEPKKIDRKLAWVSINRTGFDQIEEMLDIERNLNKLSGSPKQSYNINSFDEAPNSSWFTNRHGLTPMSAEELSRGRYLSGGPDTTAPWKVFRPKVGGATPGFWIEDSRGDQYIIKFDPPGNPEMATAAAAMATRYLYACGYNVPEETISSFKRSELTIKEGAKIKEFGKKRPFTDADLDEILARAHAESDGTYRCLASRALVNYKGPFMYKGRRTDDPNDWCPHEHRRELRGLYVISSFINHYDTKDLNTFDSYVEENGRRFMKHFLLDFGSTFGSDGNGPKPPIKGYANYFDLRDVLVSLVTLGTKEWAWQNAKPPVYPSIGYFESEIFEPNKWDPIIPNPAYENMTNRDAYWGAKIVMAFRDDDLREIVKAGQFSNPEAEEFLLKTLIERRDKIGRHWFGKVSPLDRFSVADSDAGMEIGFTDLAVEYGLADGTKRNYKFSIMSGGRQLISPRSIVGNSLTVTNSDKDAMKAQYENSGKNDAEDHLFELAILTSRGSGKSFKPTNLWLWYHPDKNSFQLVGLEHLD